ncbi:hypothetical protein [Pseudochelatococcus contaminans]|uniref:Uncharacterized protein n=1 Tax=Pseudochelatococcus contaminans TaxID=1538103 RepID=A0A7W5Z6Z8_9HYPH|nr:hypothetical protein [Pseudochelatococcus contaminans]MBB3810849.1 hypothetical protein [Pseudochelatococcus contaminans]
MAISAMKEPNFRMAPNALLIRNAKVLTPRGKTGHNAAKAALPLPFSKAIARGGKPPIGNAMCEKLQVCRIGPREGAVISMV